jgi:holo-ACP synthase
VITILLDIDCVKAKKICDQVEYQHILGGILNIEVYDENGKAVVSTDSKYTEKKCIICGEKASICKIEKKHNQWELVERIRDIYKEYTVSHHVKGY